MNLNPRRFAVAASVVLLSVSATACGGAKAGDASSSSDATSCVDTSGDTVKIGFLNSLSGTMAISEKTV